MRFTVSRSLAAVAAGVAAAVLTASVADAAPLPVQHVPMRTVMPAAPPPQGSAAQGGSYVALPRGARLSARTVRAGSVTDVPVAGRGGVPASGVGAAVVEVTGAQASAPGTLVAFTGRRGRTATVQYSAGAPSTDTAIVPLAGGGLRIADVAARGTVRLTVDVVGYYRAGRSTEAGSFHAVRHSRLIAATGVGANRTLRPVIGGRGGVPARAGAVAVSVTATRARANGAVLAADGTTQPTAAIAHVSKGRAVTAFAVLPLSGRRISLRNSSTASMSLAVDILGYYDSGVPQTGNTLAQLTPTSIAARPVAAHATTSVQVGGRAGVPKARVSAVLATVHAINPARAGTLQPIKPATAASTASVVSFGAHRSSADSVLLPVSHGQVAVRNTSAGRVTVQLDIRGYVPGNAVPSPSGTATARYLNALADHKSNPYKYLQMDEQLMNGYGCDDAKHGVTFVLLDLGAQSVTGPQLSATSPGVALALTSPQKRLSYADLRDVITSYFAGYDDSSCNAGGTAVEVALGTNNDGTFTGAHSYAARNRGVDWARLLVDPLASAATANGFPVTVVGAIDIEAAFSSTEAQAQTWDDAYLAQTTAKLINNGDANDCPTAYGATGRTCAFGWTQRQYFQLSHHGTRIAALPQLFFPAEAAKWANIDATGGGGLTFAGALTEHARVPGQLNGPQGRAALYRAVSSVVADPDVPLAVDLQADATG